MFLACLDFAELDAFLGEHILLILEKTFLIISLPLNITLTLSISYL